MEKGKMKSTRETIMQTMLEKSRATIGELAEEVGINSISVRHHIAKLEAEGLVTSEEERHGVGRPRRVYYLSERGMESFPSRYVQMSNRIIDHMKNSLPKGKVNEFFTGMAKGVVSSYIDPEDLSDMSMEERLDTLKSIMAQEGMLVDWVHDGDHYQIRGNNCPYHQIEQLHPEVCLLDKEIISNILNVTADEVHFVRQGNEHCIYEVSDRISKMGQS